MNVQHPLTDDSIRAAIARRATSGADRDLRERVLAAAAAVKQRRGWRVRVEGALPLPERKSTLLLAAAVLLLAMAIGAAVVGSMVDRTTPAPLGGLAYVSQGDLFVAGPAGESHRMVWDVPPAAVLTQPMWVDAETIVVERLPGGVYLVYIATRAVRLIDDGGELLALSPDHGRIATAHPIFGAPSRLSIVDLETGDPISDLGEIASTTPLTWSPDSRWLLGEVHRSGSSATSGSIYRVDVDTGEREDLATNLCCGLHQARPVLAPDGSSVVFVQYHDALQGEACDFRCGTLWVVDAASGARQQLTADAESEIGPVFSPDGSWIAFMEYTGGRGHDVSIVRPDGTGRQKLTNTGDAFAPAANLEPFRYLAWDPDASGLTFMRIQPGESRLQSGKAEFELWHVTLDGVATRIEAPAVSEFARQVLP